jgi:hypothetical protein
VLFFLLIAHADDYGRLQGDVLTIKMRIDPISQRTEREFALSLSIMHEVGLITWYTADNREIIEIVKFSDHQDLKGHDKRHPPKLPPCPGIHAFIGCERRKSERQPEKSPKQVTSGEAWGNLGESGEDWGNLGENGGLKKERTERKKELERERDLARESADSEGNTKPSGPLSEPPGDARPSAALGAGASSSTKPSGPLSEPPGDARPSAALGAGASSSTKPSGPLSEPPGDARPSAALGAGASSSTKPSGPLSEPPGDARPSAALGAGASSSTKPSGPLSEPPGDARPSAALGAGAQPREGPPPKPFRFDLAFEQLRNDYPPERVQDSVLIRQDFIKAFDGLENGSREDLFAKMRTSLAGHKRSEQWQDRRRVPMFGKWISERRWIQTLPTAWLAESPPPRGTGRTAVVPGKYARVAKRDDPP